MAECPVCGSRLYVQNRGIPFINLKKVFGCDACGWTADVSEIHKEGTLEAVHIKKTNKGLSRESRHQNFNKHSNNNIFSLRIFIIYWVTYTIGYFLAVNVIPLINIWDNIFVFFILVGLILELSAKVCQMFLYKKPYITMDKWFILWVGLLTIFSFVVSNIIKYFNIVFPNPIFEVIAVSFGITILVHLTWRIIYKK